ncbi:MAG: radical SAM protein, partial [Salaquimonas sp.]|nr:radical SAM protein [Salaquimonas sp.]
DYDSQWGTRMKGTGPYAWQVARRFEIAAKRLGFNTRKHRFDTSQFVPPLGEGHQLALL